MPIRNQMPTKLRQTVPPKRRRLKAKNQNSTELCLSEKTWRERERE